MVKNYNLSKSSDRRRFSRDMEKTAREKAKAICGEFTFPARGYSPYDFRQIMCPNCLRITGVKMGTNVCAWCEHQIKVTESPPFIQ